MPLTGARKKEYLRRYYQEHKIAARALAKKWRSEHPEQVKEYAARHAATQPPEKLKASMKARKKKHRMLHPEQHRNEVRRYQKSHPEKVLQAQQRRRARLAGVLTTLTSAQWGAILALHDGHCVYCGASGEMTQDHVLPISRGGAHTKENVVPACRPCNSSKGSKTPAEWRN